MQGRAAELYVEEGRKLKTLAPDGQRRTVEIGRKVFDRTNGKAVPEVDFARTPYDVEIDVGPTSASRRSAVVRTISGLISQAPDPETQIVLTHVALMNLEGEGMTGIRAWSREKLVKLGVEKPTPEEEKEIEAAAAQPSRPDPNAVLAGAMAEEAAAKAEKAKADTVLALARTKESEAKAAETLAGIPIAQQRQALETAKAIAEDMRPESGAKYVGPAT